ncbi:MAG: hypothetical protein JNM69_38525 [Archangium sp.]|nr:hypothetical protein [Archangium sp.]
MPALVALLLAASPSTGLLVELGRGDVKPALAQKAQKALMREFAGAGIEVVASACTSRACALTEAGASKRDVVVLITAAMVLKTVVLDLEAVSVKTGNAFGQTTLRVKETQLEQPLGLQDFTKSLVEQLSLEQAEPAPPPPAVVAAPVVPVLVVTPLPPASAPSRTGPIASFIGAGAFAVAGGTMALLGISRGSTLRDGMARPLPEALQLRDEGNTFFSLAFASAVLAAALVTAGIVWWLSQ